MDGVTLSTAERSFGTEGTDLDLRSQTRDPQNGNKRVLGLELLYAHTWSGQCRHKTVGTSAHTRHMCTHGRTRERTHARSRYMHVAGRRHRSPWTQTYSLRNGCRTDLRTRYTKERWKNEKRDGAHTDTDTSHISHTSHTGHRHRTPHTPGTDTAHLAHRTQTPRTPRTGLVSSYVHRCTLGGPRGGRCTGGPTGAGVGHTKPLTPRLPRRVRAGGDPTTPTTPSPRTLAVGPEEGTPRDGSRRLGTDATHVGASNGPGPGSPVWTDCSRTNGGVLHRRRRGLASYLRSPVPWDESPYGGRLRGRPQSSGAWRPSGRRVTTTGPPIQRLSTRVLCPPTSSPSSDTEGVSVLPLRLETSTLPSLDRTPDTGGLDRTRPGHRGQTQG